MGCGEGSCGRCCSVVCMGVISMKSFMVWRSSGTARQYNKQVVITQLYDKVVNTQRQMNTFLCIILTQGICLSGLYSQVSECSSYISLHSILQI